MKTRVFIRVDGGGSLGLGHLIRSLALAQMLKNTFEVVFVCKEVPSVLKSDFEKFGFKVILIDSESQFLVLIEPGNIIVLDGYNFDIDYQKSIKRKKANLVCIDDLHEGEFFADLIINHAPGVCTSDYAAQHYTEFALGPKYALLRDYFLRSVNVPHNFKSIDNILICFGGADPKNLTSKVLEIVLEFQNFKKINVITGASYQFLSTLKPYLINDRISHYHAINEKEMFDVMSQSELGIVPASGILYEMLSLKKIVITGMYVDNQRLFLDQLKKINNVVNCKDFSPDQIRDALSYVLKFKLVPESIFDGKSGERILNLFIGLEKKIYVITGGSSGLGEALTNQLLTSNHSVLSLSRRLSENQLKLGSINNKFYFLEYDFSTKISALKLEKLQALLSKFTSIVFINNVGLIKPIKPFKDIEDDELYLSLTVNVLSPAVIIKFIIKNFCDQKVDFVNITSGAANRSIQNWSLYSSTKAFMFRLFEILTEENKDNLNYRFLSIDPGMIDTEMQREIRASEFPASSIFIMAETNGSLLSPMQAAKKVLNIIDKNENSNTV